MSRNVANYIIYSQEIGSAILGGCAANRSDVDPDEEPPLVRVVRRMTHLIVAHTYSLKCPMHAGSSFIVPIKIQARRTKRINQSKRREI